MVFEAIVEYLEQLRIYYLQLVGSFLGLCLDFE